jgi:zinc finger protein CreA/MIG
MTGDFNLSFTYIFGVLQILPVLLLLLEPAPILPHQSLLDGIPPSFSHSTLAQYAAPSPTPSLRRFAPHGSADNQDDDHRMGHLAPSYGMDFDRDYSSYNLNNISTNSTGMNDISALAAAASDQLYELERHEAFRRAEFEMRHRQIASARKSNGNSPSATPASNERDKYGLNGISTPEGRVVYPVSAAQGASGNQPAVPSGTLADPTYLVPPTCCHEECHKSYRKRLKYAKATQACPNCLSQPGNGHHHNNGHGQGGNGGGSGHHSSGSNTPKDRTGGNSSEDLTKLGGSGLGGQSGGGGGGNNNNFNFHQASLHTQLAKLQQQHLAALQQARSRRASTHAQQAQGQMHGGLARPHGQHQQVGHYGGSYSNVQSANASPASSDSEDDDPPMNPVPSMNKMSLFHHRTAPSSPAVSRGPSRAGSPVEGHSANSGKHGLGSHSARDAKQRSHPYSHSHHSNSGVNIPNHFSVPNSPRLHANNGKHRMSPPDLARSLSGGGGLPRQSVEDILNSSVIPPPPSHSDRMLPPPNSTSYNSTTPSLSYSLNNSNGPSPSTSRASSPTTHSHHGHHGHHGSHHSSNLAHSVRNAFNMTPISASSSPSQKATSPPAKLAPMGHGHHGLGHGLMGSIGVGHHQQQQQQQLQQQQQQQMNQLQQMQAARSRGNSPVHGHGHGHGHGSGMKMEVDGQA